MPFFSHFFRNAAAGLIAACCLGPASGLEAQSIPVSHAFKTAEARGTRSQTGLPGKNYWQNQASYDIRLRVHPPDRLITGTERIVYRNLSPDTLREIHLKLIQNAHRPGAHRDQPVDSGYFNQGFHLHSLTLGKTGIDPARLVTAPGHNRTWEILPLSNPLAPGDSILLGISWDYTLSDSKTTEPRDGVVDSTTFFLAYFYPRVDVYDDVEGWNGQDFTELQEFYNDFSSYRVSVTVPDSYIVWATGNLLDRRITGLLAGLQADGSIHRIMDPPGKNAPGEHSWIFTADSVTDFALGLSDHYVWDGARILTGSGSSGSVLFQIARPEGGHAFRGVGVTGVQAIHFLSTVLPGWPFPYPGLTVFNGLSAMEYPMMVNDYETKDSAEMKGLTDHEISHTYFPFFMGTNESRYAFMDEGWAAFFELMITRTQLGTALADSLFRSFYLQGTGGPDASLDQSIMVPSGNLKEPAYKFNSYGKPAFAYASLLDLLGDSLLRSCLCDYIAAWHGKHPQPWDFFFSFNKSSGRNLDWFWNNWFFSKNYLGVQVRKARWKNGRCIVLLKNTGGFAIPVDLRFRFGDGSAVVVHEGPGIWKKGKSFRIAEAMPRRPASVTLDPGIYLPQSEKQARTP